MLTEKRIGPYKLTREAGRGEASTVYEAIDTRIGRTVAVKIQNAPQNLPPEQWEAMKRRMEREARAIGRVSHPNVAKVYVVGTHGRLNYLVMEFLDGVSLQERLDTGPLSPAESAHILVQVASGLEAVHAQGVVHRDIKPSNIMILADSTVKLTDFGVAHAADDPSLTSHGVMVGSPSYMSPEQAQGQPATAASDIWALGVLLYHMLTGKMPFAAESVPSVLYKIVHEDPEFPAALSEETKAVLQKALDKNAEKRFVSAGALATAFQASLHDPTVIVQKPALPPVVHAAPQPVFGIPARVRNAFSPRVPLPAAAYTPRESRPMWQTAAAGAAAFALLALGGTALWLSQRPQSAATRLPSLASSDDSTSVSASLPESRRSGVSPSPGIDSRSAPPGPVPSSGSRTTGAINKPRQVASATTGKPRVQILTSKVTPAVPSALADRPIAPKGLDGWQLGELLPPEAGLSPRVAPQETPPPQDPAPTPRPTAPVEESVRRPSPPPVETPRPPVREKPETPPVLADSDDEPTVPPSQNVAVSPDTVAELRDLLALWIEATKERHIDGQMDFYAPRLTRFYQAKNASQSAIRAEKQRVFGKANMVEMTINDPEIIFTPDGRSATMYFRKKYFIRGGPGERRGEVLQELRWRLFDDGWKIVSERDLRRR